MAQVLAKKKFILKLEFTAAIEEVTDDQIEEARLSYNNAEELKDAEWWQNSARMNKALYDVIRQNPNMINRFLRSTISQCVNSLSIDGIDDDDWLWLEDLKPSEDFDFLIRALMPYLRSEDEKILREAIKNEVLAEHTDHISANIKLNLRGASVQEFPTEMIQEGQSSN